MDFQTTAAGRPPRRLAATISTYSPVNGSKFQESSVKVLHFSGESAEQNQAVAPKNSRARKGLFSLAFWSTLFTAPLLLMPAVAQAQPLPQQPAAPNGTTRVFGDVNAQGQPLLRVNSNRDLPQLNRQLNQSVVDLMNNPLLSPSARAEIEGILTRFRQSGVGEMAVVVIPDTNQREIQTLGTNLFNQIGIGKQGKNNGVLLLINASAVRENRATGRMQLVSGTGIDHLLNGDKSVSILKQHALPHLRRGDTDQAVRETVQAVTQYLEQNQSRIGQGSGGGGEIDPEALATAGKVILGLLLLIGMGVGGTMAGSSIHSRYKKRAKDTEKVNAALKDMNSPQTVSVFNVYNLRTLEKLLTSPGVPSNPRQTVAALELVSAVATQKLTPQEQTQLTALFKEKGLTHASPDVRAFTIENLQIDKNDRELFEPYMTQLSKETDGNVIKMLQRQTAKMSQPSDLPQYKKLLSSPIPETRAVALQMMDQYFAPGSLKEFLEAAKTETKPEILRQIETITLKHAESDDDAAFLETLANGSTGSNGSNGPNATRLIALLGLAQLKKSEHFTAVYNQFKAEPTPALDETYVKALAALALQRDLPVLVQDLQVPNQRVQAESLSLIQSLNAASEVPALFTYLESSASLAKPQAKEVLLNVLDARNHEVLVNKTSSALPEVRLTAVAGLGKLGQVKDLPLLFTLAATEQGADGNETVRQAIRSGAKAPGGFDTVKKTLLSGDTPERTKQACVFALSQFGIQALTPLFQALAATNPSASDKGLTADLVKAIPSVSTSDEALPVLLEQVDSSHSGVKQAACQGAAGILKAWHKASYDDEKKLAKLRTLSNHGNPVIQTAAKAALAAVIQNEISELESLGARGDFDKSSVSGKLKSRSSSAADASVKTAAASALKKLNKRKSDHEEAVARKKRQDEEDDRRRRESYSSSSSSYSYSSGSSDSGGFGGGISGGGGGGI